MLGLLVVLIFLAGNPDDPVVRRLARAPEDDEARDPSEDKAAARGKAEYLRGERGVPWEKLGDEMGRS